MFQNFFKPKPIDKTEPPKQLSIDEVFMKVSDFLGENKSFDNRENRKNIYVFCNPDFTNDKYVIGKFCNTWIFDFIFQNCQGDVCFQETLSLKNLGDVYFTDASGANKNLLVEALGADFAKSVLLSAEDA